MRRRRKVKILATLGPASSDEAMIRKLFEAGADVFRINMSHASHDLMRELVRRLRNVEKEVGRPIGILADLQGPKLRVGKFAEAGHRLLIDDGKLALVAESSDGKSITCRVVSGTKISDKKGVSLPDTTLGVGALTEKDRRDLDAVLQEEVDWVALSFIQRPEDLAEV
eukprot:gene29255-35769_t